MIKYTTLFIALPILTAFGILISVDGAHASCAPACDLNGDGVRASVADYGVFLASFGSKRGEPKFVAAADIDGSGAITAADWGLLNKFCPLGGSDR